MRVVCDRVRRWLPWSGAASASPNAVFQIDAGPGGTPCTATEPFAPQLVSGTKSNQAGGFSPYSLTYYRADGEQNLARIQLTTPPGLLGTLSNVALCGEPQAQQGTCGPESQWARDGRCRRGLEPLLRDGRGVPHSSCNGAPYGLASWCRRLRAAEPRDRRRHGGCERRSTHRGVDRHGDPLRGRPGRPAEHARGQRPLDRGHSSPVRRSASRLRSTRRWAARCGRA